MTRVSIVTFNLLNKPSRWEQRRGLIVDELGSLQPDLIALQEVALPDNTAQWLADRLGGYSVHTCSKTGPLHGQEGIAILSRLPVDEFTALDLRTQNRVAERVRVRVGGRPLALVNGHFFFHVVDHIQRVRQVQALLRWLGDSARHTPTVICGDFNDTPGSRSINLMRQHFVSAHSARHGSEPDFTAPTLLKYEFSGVRRALSRLGNAAVNRSFKPWRGTVDYIFVDPRMGVLDCRTVLKRPAAHDRTLYPSDHIGLAATLALA